MSSLLLGVRDKLLASMSIVVVLVVVSLVAEASDVMEELVTITQLRNSFVEVGIRTTIASPQVEGTGSVVRSHHLFPQFFSELLSPTERSLWEAETIAFQACAGRWQVEWGMENSTEPCRGQSLSAGFVARGGADRDDANSDPNSSSSASTKATTATTTTTAACPAWRRVINTLGVTLGSSFSQFHPSDCLATGEGTTTATMNALHLSHVAITTGSSSRRKSSSAEKETEMARQHYYGQVPVEPVCTEQLKPLLALLPAQRRKSKTTSSRPAGVWEYFLPSDLALFASPYHRIAFRVKRDTETGSFFYDFEVNFVLPTTDFLAKLDAGVRKELSSGSSSSPIPTARLASPLSATAKAKLVTPSGGDERQWNLKEVPPTDFIQLLSVASHSPSSSPSGGGGDGSLSSQSQHCGRLLSSTILQRGEVDGFLQGSASFPRGGPTEGRLLMTFPLHVMRPLLHTLVSVPAKALEVIRVESIERGQTMTVLYAIKLPVDTTKGATPVVTWSLRYHSPYLNVNHYPPDANKAYWLPSVHLQYQVKKGGQQGGSHHYCPCGRHLHYDTLREFFSVPSSSSDSRIGRSGSEEQGEEEEGEVCIDTSQAGTALSLPIPDVSMPFNALALACVVYAMLYGALYSMTVRN